MANGSERPGKSAATIRKQLYAQGKKTNRHMTTYDENLANEMKDHRAKAKTAKVILLEVQMRMAELRPAVKEYEELMILLDGIGKK